MCFQDLNQFNPRARRSPGSGSLSAERMGRKRLPKLVAMRPQTVAGDSPNARIDKNASFGDRRRQAPSSKASRDQAVKNADGGVMEMSWMPTTSARDDDRPDDWGAAGERPRGKKRKGVETFGAGMEKGVDVSEAAGQAAGRTGRTKRRSGVRSGSRNVFRKL